MRLMEIRCWCVAITMLLAVLVAPAGLAAQVATGAISGTVVAAGSGGRLVGAQVSVPATRQGVVVGADGSFVIARVAVGRVKVRAQMIGYEPADTTVTVTAGGMVRVTFHLRRTALTLSRVVITATGAERAREIGTAVSTIDSASLANAPVVNVQQILTGRTTGATVIANSGQPGAGGTIRLRGINSISQGNSPLIYVDGVRIYNGSTGTSVIGRQDVRPLNDIDASQIDHVAVIKGPAATTLYGTEASGGVIQIFTKRGMAGRPQYHFEIGQGFNFTGHLGPKSDPTGLFMNECSGVHTNGAGKTFEDPTCPTSGTWLRDGPVQRYAADVRGGTADATYYLGANYNEQMGVLQMGGNRDGTLRGNFSFHPATGLEFGLSSQVTGRHVDWVGDGNSANGALINISRGANSNFKAGVGCDPSVDVCLNNSELFDATSFTRESHFITGLTTKYDAEGPLSAHLNIGYDYLDMKLESLYPFGFSRQPLGQIWVTPRNRTLVTTDFAANWRQPLGGAWITTTSVGGQMFNSQVEDQDLESDYFAGPGQPILTSGSQRLINDATNQRVINAGFFVQELVGWRDRVFVTAAVRVDGNSAFGSSFGLQTYPKLSGSYVISDESWWHVPHVETLKLRAAMGESGKAPGAFDAVRTWNPVAAQDGQPAFTPSQVGNANLGPERTRETETGFDLSAFAGRLGVSATYYQQHTFDALIPVEQPPSDGFTNRQLENVGRLNNTGAELSLDGELLRVHNVNWTGHLNYSWNKSTAGNLGGQTITIEDLSRTYVKKGYPVPSYFGLQVTNPGAFATPTIINDGYLGATYPDRIISPSTTLRLWNAVELGAIGEWQLGGHLLNAVGYQNARYDIWQPCFAAQDAMRAGDVSGVDALQQMKCTLSGSERDYAYWVEPADFFKLRSVTLTYDIPAKYARGMHHASVTLAGQNLWTSTKYTGTDPEVADIRTSSFSRRDYYVFPTFRTFTATLRFGF